MTNRRSILQTLSTIALALVAPIVAFAGGRKRDPRALGRDGKWYPARVVGTFGPEPMVITPREDLTPEQIAEFKRLWEEAQKRETAARTCLGCGNYSWALPAGSVSWDDWECRDCGTRNGSCATLRALLAEARDQLREDHCLMAYDDGEPAQFGDAFRIDHGSLIARIDAALK